MKEKTARQALIVALVYGTGLQGAMVLVGHWVEAVAALFGPLGVGISLLAGFLYGLWSPDRGAGPAAGWGAVAGGGCALVGILVSWALGDVGGVVLAAGTAGSAVAGAAGGFGGRAVARRAPA